jgi:hypothetical protein
MAQNLKTYDQTKEPRDGVWKYNIHTNCCQLLKRWKIMNIGLNDCSYFIYGV